MKKIFLVIILLICINQLSAQVPQGIPYQAVARNGQGQPLPSTNVKVRFSILDSTATGTAVYVESHNTTTSALGLFTANVGLGTASTGTFSAINWGQNYKFLKVELDTTATGNSYIDLGTQQMMSVPYALWAGGLTQDQSTTNEVIDTNLEIVSAKILMPSSYTIPQGEYWKLVSLFTSSNFGYQSQTLNYSGCSNLPPGAFGTPNCFYNSNPIPVIKLNNDVFYGTKTSETRFPTIGGCSSCPPTASFDISFGWDKSLIGFPIWLQPNDQLIIYDNLRVSVEKYK
jgi:hypothetical protein